MAGSGVLLGTLLFLLLGPGFLETSQYLYSEVIIPQVIHGRFGIGTEKEISYLIKIEGVYRIVHLQQKSFIIANMPFYTFNMQGERLVDHPYIQDDCYYDGYVEDVPDSEVVLSTCAGLWGHVRLGSLTYEIQPIENSPTFQHLVHLAAPNQHESCRGTLEDQDELERNEWGSGNADSRAANSSMSSVTDPVDAAARYLEYYVVCDSSMYQWENHNETRVMLLMLQIISVLHNIYQEIGLHIILIGMEMRTERDFSIVSHKKLARTLERFYNYATFELQRQVHFDHATLYTRIGEEGSFGMSWGERLCLYNHVSVSVIKTSPSTTHSGVSAAHELGHSLGFLHDDSLGGNMTSCDCNCVSKPGRCVMYSGVVECRRLSECSKKAYYELLRQPGKSCLQNRPMEAAVRKECGNGIVEGDEECDCGSVQESFRFAHYREYLENQESQEYGPPTECWRNGCCRSNCTVKPGADCFYGLCCEQCKMAEEGTLCRKAASDCDLPEFCSGVSAECPPDVHKQDGEPCGTGDTCLGGKCSDLSRNCRAIFGQDAKRAPQSCFKKVNTQGDRTGNCGKEESGYKKCEEEHVTCGRIQCTNIKRIPVLPTRQAILQTPVGSLWCWGVEFQGGPGGHDIGATPDGSACGAGKICINRSCVHSGAQQSNCDSNKCNNRGVCNSRKNCHCAYGWAPPFCQGKGYGGSIDSGPPPKHSISTNIIIGSAIGGVGLLLTALLIKKYVVPSWLARRDMEEGSDLDDAEPIEEEEEEEAPPLEKPTEETAQETR